MRVLGWYNLKPANLKGKSSLAINVRNKFWPIARLGYELDKNSPENLVCRSLHSAGCCWLDDGVGDSRLSPIITPLSSLYSEVEGGHEKKVYLSVSLSAVVALYKKTVVLSCVLQNTYTCTRSSISALTQGVEMRSNVLRIKNTKKNAKFYNFTLQKYSLKIRGDTRVFVEFTNYPPLI